VSRPQVDLVSLSFTGFSWGLSPGTIISAFLLYAQFSHCLSLKKMLPFTPPSLFLTSFKFPPVLLSPFLHWFSSSVVQHNGPHPLVCFHGNHPSTYLSAPKIWQPNCWCFKPLHPSHSFSCQNKSVCQKLAWSCKKWKLVQKAIYALFAWDPSNINKITSCLNIDVLVALIY